MNRGLFIPTKGTTFLLPTPARDDPSLKHLAVLLTDPVTVGDFGKDMILLVNLSSVPASSDRYDKSCVLTARDHPFVRHRSYVAYQHARIVSAKSLRLDYEEGKAPFRSTMKPPVFAAVCAGFERSPRVPEKAAEFYRLAIPK